MVKQKHIYKLFIACGVGILSLASLSVIAGQLDSSSLTIEKAIKTAQKNDPWLTGNIHKQKSLESMSTAVGTLPDPKISIGLANLPTNGFDFGQEGMTQAKIGITQMFPRGDKLDIQSEQLRIQSEAFPFQRQDREAKVAVTVGTIWLDAYRVQESIALIERNRSLFEQLIEVVDASYSSGLGKTRQQDLVRAQLELTRLEDRLEELEQQKSRFEGMLSQWLTVLSDNNAQSDNIAISIHGLELSKQLPQIELLNHELMQSKSWLMDKDLILYFVNHPSIIAIDKKIKATKTGIKLAEQKYKPEWGVTASYGYRADDPMGNSRADLFSIGVTFDLPIFTENRQDQEVKSAISETESVKTEKLLLLRQLLGAYSSAKGRLQRLQDRQILYRTKLLPQMHEQAEASLTAYTNDDGDFSETVRSRISVLNAEIDELTLNVEQQKLHLELNYLFIGELNTTSLNDMNATTSNPYATGSGEK